QHDRDYHSRECVKKEHLPGRVKQYRNRQGIAEKQDLARDHLDQGPASWSGKSMAGYPACRDAPEVMEEVPHWKQEPVEHPQVVVLKAVQASTRLRRRQTGQRP